jgi:hypothetical protein
VKTYFTDTRPNGKPVDAGTLCFVIDPEDGTHPQFIYGKTEDEIRSKMALTTVNAQTAMARTIAAARQTAPIPGSTPVAPRPRLSADEHFQATGDLSVAGKSGGAAVRLIEDETGLDLTKIALREYGTVARQWQAGHPEFYPHPGNLRQMSEKAAAYAGGLGRVTVAIMEQVYNELVTSGYLYPASAEPSPSSEPPSNLTEFPDGSQVQRRERPRGAMFATGARSTRFGAPPAPGQTRPQLKYTKAQIDGMSLAKSTALIQSDDKDYADACEFYYPSAGQAAMA